ncbi:hypothetical protein AVEN_74392-1 [Araneus ventricosus]|uniref:Uncharacterized protein n=1 Tax=Araneus ventricosus TaxID=182803 RepID=A0A4Y2LQB7_ARAVE|nr:hypothetical protein AVEN_74392-1 [Araneus ventricosus]
MTPCRSNNSTSPLPSPLHSCLVEAPMQSMIRAGEAGQEQGQEEKVFSLSMNFKLLMCPLRKNLLRTSKTLMGGGKKFSAERKGESSFSLDFCVSEWLVYRKDKRASSLLDVRSSGFSLVANSEEMYFWLRSPESGRIKKCLHFFVLSKKINYF